MVDISIAQAVGGSIALFCGAVLAGAAGIGGGGLNVPILILAFGFEFRTAAAISLCQVLGNVITQLALNYKSAHPHNPKRPLMYWDVISVYVPAQICGSSIGVLFRNMIPRTVMESIAMVVLIFAATKTIFKAVQVSRDEKLGKKAQGAKTSDHLNVKLINFDDSDGISNSSSYGTLDRIVVPKIVMPWHQVRSVAAMWVVFAILFASLVLVDKCSGAWWAILTCCFVPLVVQLVSAIMIVSRHQIQVPESKLEGDVDWSENFYAGPITVIGIGFLSALLGIGGGELMGPLFVLLKFLPQVASATTPVLSFLTTLSNVTQYGLRGDIPLVYGAWTFGIGIAGGYCGRKAAIVISTKGRPSFTVFALGVILYVAAALLVFVVVDEGVHIGSDPFCS